MHSFIDSHVHILDVNMNWAECILKEQLEGRLGELIKDADKCKKK